VSLVSNFGTPDINGLDIALRSDGKFYISGTYYDVNATNSSIGPYRGFIYRCNENGRADTTFSGDGMISIEENNTIGIYSLLDGRIITVGTSTNVSTSNCCPPHSSIRYFNEDGGNTYIFETILSFTATDFLIQTDQKIVISGYSSGATGNDFTIMRYNADLSIDATFGNAGIVRTDFNTTNDRANAITIAPDGKLLIAGTTSESGTIAIAKYNPNGSLDTSFNSDGKVTANFNMPTGSVMGDVQHISIQPDGKIIVAGSGYSFISQDFLLARFNYDGSVDYGFGNNAVYVERGSPVILDSTAQAFDSDLLNYSGTSIILYRHGGANVTDIFSCNGNLEFIAGNAILSGIIIGEVTTGNGTLLITFNSNATFLVVKESLSSITYANTSHTPPSSIQIDWEFSDGNTGTQGIGGPLSAIGSTTVIISPGRLEKPQFLSGWLI
jgi:uncharacterized delta-60 repeat protein